MAKSKKVLMVVRDCCTAGNCVSCMSVPGHKYGEKVSVVQFLTYLPSMAEKVAHNFRAYNAKVEEATRKNIEKLEERSADWVRKSLGTTAVNDSDFLKVKKNTGEWAVGV